MVHCLNTGEVYQPLAAFRSTFYTGTVHIYWQFIFEIIWFLLISDELIIIICLTLSWLWCWCRFMSASPGFHFWLLSGSRAHRDTCVPPITELWKFLGFKHCSLIHFHFHICYCYHRAELFRVSPQLLFLSLKHELSVRIHTNTTMRTQFLCAIYLVAFDKSSLGNLHTVFICGQKFWLV